MRSHHSHSPIESKLIDNLIQAKPKDLKNLIKYVLTSDNFSGDSSELCISADLKTILGLYGNKDLNVLTAKQRHVIIEHLVNDKQQTDVAQELGISQQGVSILLASALKRIKKYITDEDLKWTPWPDEDKEFLLSNFNKMNIIRLSEKLGKPKSRVISMYYYLKRINAQNME